MTRPSLFESAPPTAWPKTIARVFLGVSLVFSGTGHLTFMREGFVAQVPNVLPFSEDFVVLASGVVEITLGDDSPPRYKRS